MICLVCRQAELGASLTSIKFERGEMRLLVKGVPAWVCPRCREAYVEEEVAVRLLRKAEELSAAGAWETELEYPGSQAA